MDAIRLRIATSCMKTVQVAHALLANFYPVVDQIFLEVLDPSYANLVVALALNEQMRVLALKNWKR